MKKTALILILTLAGIACQREHCRQCRTIMQMPGISLTTYETTDCNEIVKEGLLYYQFDGKNLYFIDTHCE